MKSKWLALCLFLLLVSTAGTHAAAVRAESGSPAFTEEEKKYIGLGETVFVAGNPELYPYEYYDEDRKEFLGVLPEFLREIGSVSGVRFSYVNPGAKDNRFYLAKNLQVEMYSCGEDEVEDGVFFLTAGTAEGERRLGFAFTQTADPSLRTIVQKSLLALDQTARDRILLSQAGERKNDSSVLWMVGGAAALIPAALAAFLLWKRERRRSMGYRYFDRVTGLWNTEYLRKNYEELITNDSRLLYCVIYISARLGHLRSVYSEKEADSVLRHIADVLTTLCGDRDLPARVGSEDFAVVKRCAGRDGALDWTRELMGKICAYPVLNHKDYFLDPRFGIYRLKPMDAKLETPLANARQMAHFAVERQLSCVVCNEKILRDFEESLALETEAVKALERNEFRVYIQPYVELRTGAVCGGEALARWEHPFRGFIKPDRFIPLLEECSLISQVDFRMFQLTCEWIQKRREAGQKTAPLSCNFSRINLKMTNFFNNVINTAKQYAVSLQDVYVEITEGVMPRSGEEERKRVMDLLRNEGLRIYLDDFGSGGASYQDLRDYPLDTIKIDKSILNGAEGEQGEAILESLITLGHRLGARVLCEGVETEDQARLLLRLGCDAAQGYYYYQPMPLSEFEKVLEG